jgi:hypothetical protein
VILCRLLIRTVRRLVTMTDVGNDNREQFRRVFGRRSIILWAIRSYSPLRKEYEMTISALQPNGPYIIRHRSPKETGTWFSKLRGRAQSACGEDSKEVNGICWATEGSQP